MAGDTFGGFSEGHVYSIALSGLMAFYGLAQVDRSRRAGIPVTDARGASVNVGSGVGAFWIHMGSYCLVGYLLLHREATDPAVLAFLTVAMALPFVVTDYGLNEDHEDAYRRIGHRVLVVAVVAGFVGAAAAVSDAAIAALTAFLGGGVILNVLKDEVPSER